MDIKVTINNVTIKDTELIHSGEFKVNEIDFEFTNDYDDLIKRALFTKKNKSYYVEIVNDKCYIPAEVLTENGDLEIGVYGYSVSGEDLTLRYSPHPANIKVIKGSYKSADEGSTYVPAEDFVTKAEFNTSQGVQDSAIAGIKNGTTINSFRDVEEALPTKVSDLNNDTGFITKDENNLTYYYTKLEVDNKVSSVYKYKGSVATYNDLPSTGLTAGDVYNVEEDGSNYAWTGTAWDKLGGEVDLSDYYTKSQIDSMIGDISSALDTINGEVI